MEQPKKQLSEAELKRLIALDRARVEENLARSKASGRKIGAVIAIAIALVAAITIFVVVATNSRK
ncbi:hypothetical protein IJ090_03350 [Candidatus Saccharibacteria bacterium]|nr:hypothetical protein [Candidatus Saccharibacteria bacterium]